MQKYVENIIDEFPVETKKSQAVASTGKQKYI